MIPMENLYCSCMLSTRCRKASPDRPDERGYTPVRSHGLQLR